MNQEVKAALRAVREGRSAKSSAQQFNIARTPEDIMQFGNVWKARLLRNPTLTAALENNLIIKLKYVVQYDINWAQAISIYSSRKERNIKK
jgi:hypothetical protein